MCKSGGSAYRFKLRLTPVARETRRNVGLLAVRVRRSVHRMSTALVGYKSQAPSRG